jgi:hypothetical protein
MPPEPDLTAELDAAEDIAMGHAETVEVEWGVRRPDLASGVFNAGNERMARFLAADCGGAGALVRRTVTYGPWEEAPDGR